MDPEYERLLKTPKGARILASQSPLLDGFVAEHRLAPAQWAFYRPLEWCEQSRCFVNVDQQIVKMGGTALVGWMFWEIENTMIHTEAHCIWVTPQGTWIDITPQALPPKRVMFSPDARVAANRGHTLIYETLLTRNQKEIALSRFCRALSEIWEESFRGIGQEMNIPMQKIKQAVAESGLPDDVAQYVLQKRVKAYEEAQNKFGNK